MSPREIVLIRHAETEWSADGRHTGRTDIPLTDAGRQAAQQLAKTLSGRRFQAVLVSPLRRARETCQLCGLGDVAEALHELAEWDYGEYEGLTSVEIEQTRRGWSLWRDGCPGGEGPVEVGARADAVIKRLSCLDGDVAVFSHGHLLRVLGARWVELDPGAGERLMLGTGALCTLSSEHGTRAIARWNERSDRALEREKVTESRAKLVE